jgi:hypothetical protein
MLARNDGTPTAASRVLGCPVAEPAVPVVAPTHRLPVDTDGAHVAAPTHQGDDPVERRCLGDEVVVIVELDDRGRPPSEHRRGPIDEGAVSELALTVGAPALDVASHTEDARVPRSCDHAYRRADVGPGDGHRRPPFLRRAVS